MKKEQTDNSIVIYGRNAVREAVRRHDGGEILYRTGLERELSDILSYVRTKPIRCRAVSNDDLTKTAGTSNHQGVAMILPPFSYSSVDEMLRDAEAANEKPLLVLLDSIQDPHNLGAIIRTAHQAGAHGVIIPKNRAAAVNGTVYKTSAGAAAFTKIAEVTNLHRTIEELKKKGLWFVLADMDGQELYSIDMTVPLGIIIGSEGSGPSELTKRLTDFTASIPMKGRIDSLNASVAAGILIYEAVRQRSRMN